jgi:hypothetical protein
MRTVTVEATGYLSWSRKVAARDGEETLVAVALKRPRGRSTGWLLATIGGFIAAAGMEAFAVVHTLQANEHVADTRAFDDDRKLAVVGHAVAGGLAVLSGVTLYFYLVSGQSERAKPKSQVAVRVVPTRGGAAAVGTFHF